MGNFYLNSTDLINYISFAPAILSPFFFLQTIVYYRKWWQCNFLKSTFVCQYSLLGIVISKEVFIVVGREHLLTS